MQEYDTEKLYQLRLSPGPVLEAECLPLRNSAPPSFLSWLLPLTSPSAFLPCILLSFLGILVPTASQASFRSPIRIPTQETFPHSHPPIASMYFPVFCRILTFNSSLHVILDRMEGSAFLEAKGKIGVLPQQRDTLSGAAAVPTSTPTCVIVKSFKTAVDQVRGTIKLKTQMDNSFSIFLRGKCTEQQFQVRVLSVLLSSTTGSADLCLPVLTCVLHLFVSEYGRLSTRLMALTGLQTCCTRPRSSTTLKCTPRRSLGKSITRNC